MVLMVPIGATLILANSRVGTLIVTAMILVAAPLGGADHGASEVGHVISRAG
jgi:hypothetical protein